MSNAQELLFLDNLEQLMKEHNVSKRELAEAVGISPSTITTWYKRNSTSISGVNLLDIADYFGVDSIDLMYGKPKRKLVFTTDKHTERELDLINSFANYLYEYRLELLEQIHNDIFGKSKNKFDIIDNPDYKMDILSFDELMKETMKRKVR